MKYSCTRTIQVNLIRKWSNMGQCDKERASDYEKSDTFQNKRNFSRIMDTESCNDSPEYDRSIYEEYVDIDYREIAQYDIGN